MTKDEIHDAVRAVEYAQGIARGLIPGVVFHGAWHYLRACEIDVSSTFGRIFSAAFYSEIQRMYPRGVPTATIRGIPDTIIPE